MTERLRVLVVDHTAELAGGEVALARLLAQLDATRFDVRVLLLAEGPLAERLRVLGIPVAVVAASDRLTGAGREDVVSSPLRLIGSAARTIALVPRLMRAIRSARADLVVANTLKAAVLVSLAAPATGRRWVWHLHDRIAPDYLPRPLVAAMRVIARLGPRMIVANSEATRATLPGVPKHRIVVAYPGIDMVAGAATTAEPLADHGRPPLLGLLGRIAPTKGQVEFLEAAARIAATHQDVRFVIIGDALFNDAPFAEGVRGMPAALGIAERVEFTGWLENPATTVSALTALVHASPVPEPFGQVLVEAMLIGTPVIGTDAGGVPEILEDPRCGGGGERVAGVRKTPLGLLVRPGDVDALSSAMNWMLEHPVERASMAEAARRSARERFDIRLSAHRVADAWARAARRSAPPEQADG
ncbi:glycosyltransferase family 4 protein [Humibacter albus]|uniref:glycosyltransferase family 4 protein n=1 Tax=Humibacter albus TaxID=427754 RepID=UPI0003B4DAF4|nr:glycosyltransferase family 4 protein [Humibacter albus]